MLVAVLTGIGSPGSGFAVDPGAEPGRGTLEDDTRRTRPDGDRGLGIVVVPIPKSDPTFGAGLVVPLLLLYEVEGSARPWMSGAGAMYTASGSWATGVFQKAYLFGDRLRLTAALAYGSFDIDFFGVGSAGGASGRSVPIEQRSPMAYVKGLWQVAPNVFAGPYYRYNDVRTKLPSVTVPDVDVTVPGLDAEVRVSAFGLAAEYDTRDSEQNPRSGTYASASVDLPRRATGSTFDYTTARASINHYRRIDGRSAWAARVAACATGADVPYFNLCQFGMQGDLRGYETGRYRDRTMLAVQGEYRWRSTGRWGAVAFAGFGGVAPQLEDVLNGPILPSAGFGLRWRVSSAYDINISADLAWGRDDNRGFYLRIGEAF